VCGPVDVVLDGVGLPWVTYMTAKCQNVSITQCADIACATGSTTLVERQLQQYFPDMNTIFSPSLAVRSDGSSLLLAFPSDTGSGSNGGGISQGGVGNVALISSSPPAVHNKAVFANQTSRCVVATSAQFDAAVIAYVMDRPAPDYVAVVVSECADTSCSSLQGTQTLETGGESLYFQILPLHFCSRITDPVCR
jgi:hypothetical protein